MIQYNKESVTVPNRPASQINNARGTASYKRIMYIFDTRFNRVMWYKRQYNTMQHIEPE